MGANNIASGRLSTAMGSNTRAPSAFETVIGSYNTVYTPSSDNDWNNDDRLFVIGNGASSFSRSDALVVMKNGKVGINNSDPDEEFVVGSNLGSEWSVPAATVGGSDGGSIEVGTPVLKFAVNASPELNRTRLIASDGSGFGGGTIEMRTRQLNIGTNPGVNNNRFYPLRVVQGGWGFNIQNESVSASNWELYVLPAGELQLYFDNSLRGSFNSATGNYSSTSDARLKTNIRPMEGTLGKLMQVQPRIYNFKTDLQNNYHGFLAQELQLVFPEVVSKAEGRNGDGQNTLVVDYAQISVLSVKAIQEQQEIIELQKQLLESLQNEVDNLRERLNRLEKMD